MKMTGPTITIETDDLAECIVLYFEAGIDISPFVTEGIMSKHIERIKTDFPDTYIKMTAKGIFE